MIAYLTVMRNIINKQNNAIGFVQNAIIQSLGLKKAEFCTAAILYPMQAMRPHIDEMILGSCHQFACKNTRLRPPSENGFTLRVSYAIIPVY